MLTKIFENILSAGQRDGHVSILFFDFLSADLRRCIIGNSCSLYDCILLWSKGSDCIVHILCRSDRHDVYKRWWSQRDRSADQSHFGTSLHSSFCQGISHFAGGMIGDKAHRINGFLSRTGGDQYFFAGQIFFVSQFP